MPLNTERDESQRREEMVAVVTLLEQRSFNQGTTGNVSCRLGDCILITPTGGNSANLTPQRLVLLASDGTVRGDGVASSEWHMHCAIMNAFPAVKAIVHTHADACVAASCLRQPIPAFHYMVAGFGGNDIPCADYATFGSEALAANVVHALANRKACLLANHGMMAAGHTLRSAFDLTVKLETLARQYLMARHAGEPAIISDEEMELVHAQYAAGYERVSLP